MDLARGFFCVLGLGLALAHSSLEAVGAVQTTRVQGLGWVLAQGRAFSSVGAKFGLGLARGFMFSFGMKPWLEAVKL